MNTPDQTPIEAATSALTRAIADDLYAASTTGDVIDMLVKGDYETWREHAERIGGIAAENTPAAVAVLLAGDWLERVLGEHEHAGPSDVAARVWCVCGERLLVEDFAAHQAAAIRDAATGGAA